MLLYGQLMWISTPGIEEKQQKVQWYKKNSKTNASSCSYNRMLFFRFVSEKQTDQLNRIFCVMQNSTTNQHFFNRLSVARDNGQCTIGSLIAIVNPDPIENYMRGIPMITSIPLQNDLQANETKAFVLHKVELTIRRLLFKDTKCSGMFCDRQNIE